MAKERYTYTIDENNAISIVDNEYPNEDGSPNVFQPGHPSDVTTPWASKEEAEEYAKHMIAELINPTVIPQPVSINPDDDSVIASE